MKLSLWPGTRVDEACGADCVGLLDVYRQWVCAEKDTVGHECSPAGSIQILSHADRKLAG